MTLISFWFGITHQHSTGTYTTLSSDLANALATEEFVDVTFRFPKEGNSTIRCHRVILQARSHKFGEMLKFKKRDEVIDIEDVPYQIFRLLIEICYTDSLANCPTHVRTLLVWVREYLPDSYRRVLSSLIKSKEVPNLCVHVSILLS